MLAASAAVTSLGAKDDALITDGIIVADSQIKRAMLRDGGWIASGDRDAFLANRQFSDHRVGVTVHMVVYAAAYHGLFTARTGNPDQADPRHRSRFGIRGLGEGIHRWQ